MSALDDLLSFASDFHPKTQESFATLVRFFADELAATVLTNQRAALTDLLRQRAKHLHSEALHETAFSFEDAARLIEGATYSA